ncbi:39S ribosomal protein L49, mitochondrial-like [Haliotis rubra]|uniref:39S ribosomal protein L49, mitochondrial-like n=1 Tax=Haliotis rubra TaxID=36100 RepID=UPI001EE61263|nr:39S ribosomal protein L49, mitochondrial-like [Haliotis rubra]
MAMAAVPTWCRFQILMGRLKSIALNTSSRYYSASGIQDNQAQKEKSHPAYEVSTEEFKFVETLLPRETVPDPPVHESYPTPSGWVPPAENQSPMKYFVKRTKNHMLPLYMQTTHAGNRHMVMIRKVEGDIWAFESDIRQHLEKVSGKKVAVQVHEVGRFIR